MCVFVSPWVFVSLAPVQKEKGISEKKQTNKQKHKKKKSNGTAIPGHLHLGHRYRSPTCQVLCS